MALIGKHRDFGWTPLLWLVYLAFLFIQPLSQHTSATQWLVLVAITLFFLALYFSVYFAQHFWRGRTVIVPLLMAGLGLGYLRWNVGATAFLIYGAAIVPFTTSPLMAAVFITSETLALAETAHLLHMPLAYWGWSAFMCVAIGGGNIYFAERKRSDRKLEMAHDEIERLAKIAERERIARDMHDVLGHTLTLIVLKAELAAKLAHSDPERAAREMSQVEQTARRALEEVREAIRGYKSEGFAAEIARARRTLEDVGIRTECEVDVVNPSPTVDSALSLALREAVTNIVRHADARRCIVRVSQQDGRYRLSLEDDGCGIASAEGMGLRGMRERIEGLGGTVSIRGGTGTVVEISVPEPRAAALVPAHV
jgi:two-component system, NarL family, sensor histidine kinase DesK